jgi:hypothetical protein
MSETKQIVLTGDAADSVMSRGRRGRRKSQNGGGSTQAGTITQLHSTSSSSDNTTAVEGVNPSKMAEVAANVSAPTTILKTQDAGAQSKVTKVVLKAPKRKTQKVVLSVAKTISIPKPTVTNKARTRKASKRIQFSLKNLRNKLHKAKTIKKSSEEKPLNEIKKILTEAKLIKGDSKAPEQMVRQIYNDYMSLKHKAL